jgi:hypothetical protein
MAAASAIPQDLSAFDAARALERIGMKLIRDGGRQWLALVHGHPEIEDIFAGSPWQAGRWCQVLREAPGARVASIELDGRTVEALLIPLEVMLEGWLPPNATGVQ